MTHLECQRLAMRRLRAERRHQDTSQLPPRIRARRKPTRRWPAMDRPEPMDTEAEPTSPESTLDRFMRERGL